MQLFKNMRLLKSATFVSKILTNKRSVNLLAPRFFSQFEFNDTTHTEASKISGLPIDTISKNMPGPDKVEGLTVTHNNQDYDVLPINDFSDEGKFSMFQDQIKTLSFDKLTPIQSYGIPIVMSGQDLVGIAKTGSGKTLAFMLPCIHHTLNYKKLYREVLGRAKIRPR